MRRQVPCELWLKDEMGKPANLWDMFKERPEREDQFSKAMTAIDQLVRICSFSFFAFTHQGCRVWCISRHMLRLERCSFITRYGAVPGHACMLVICRSSQEQTHASSAGGVVKDVVWVTQGKLALVTDYEWSRFDRVLDIWGAYGSMLEVILRVNTSAKGVLFDLPQVCLLSYVAIDFWLSTNLPQLSFQNILYVIVLLFACLLPTSCGLSS